MLTNKDRCVLCNKTSSLQCSRCKITPYCSKACQTKDWKQHKQLCTTTAQHIATFTQFNGLTLPTTQKQLVIVRNNNKDTVVVTIHKVCAICNLPTQLRCGGCRATAYCSKKCQAEEWHLHKKICSKSLRSWSTAEISQIITTFSKAYKQLMAIQRMGMKLTEIRPHNFNAFMIVLLSDDNSPIYSINAYHSSEDVFDIDRITIIQEFGDSYIEVYFKMEDESDDDVLDDVTLTNVDFVRFFRPDIIAPARCITYLSDSNRFAEINPGLLYSKLQNCVATTKHI